jgi:Ca-activated chloride channel family protein
VAVTDLDGAFGTAAPRLRQCYAAAYFAEVLRNSRYGTEVRLADLGRLADDVAAATDDPDVSELAGLVRKAAGLYG